MENIESGEDFTFPLTSSETDIDMLCEDRVFDFAVAKTKDQGESANITPGFEVRLSLNNRGAKTHLPSDFLPCWQATPLLPFTRWRKP